MVPIMFKIMNISKLLNPKLAPNYTKRQSRLIHIEPMRKILTFTSTQLCKNPHKNQALNIYQLIAQKNI